MRCNRPRSAKRPSMSRTGSNCPGWVPLPSWTLTSLAGTGSDLTVITAIAQSAVTIRNHGKTPICRLSRTVEEMFLAERDEVEGERVDIPVVDELTGRSTPPQHRVLGPEEGHSRAAGVLAVQATDRQVDHDWAATDRLIGDIPHIPGVPPDRVLRAPRTRD